jgi:AAHS family 3-hydroxyphenylpropionic acid transporter
MPRAPVPLTIIFCALAALFEGFDNQSMGVAGPGVAREFGLQPGQMGIIFSSATLGLFLGAALGGRIADRFGRRGTLAASLLLFGAFSLLTSMAIGPRTLIAARFLTGLGLGGAMPNFIALCSEAAPSDRRVTLVATIMAAMPLGGAITGLIALTDSWGWSWRTIFYIGGIGPILLSLLAPRFLDVPAAPRGSSSDAGLVSEPLESVLSVLFGNNRARATALLWISFFFTQLVLLLMLNWLPSLIVGLGFSRTQASWASVCFNVSGALASNLLSRLHASRLQRVAVVAIYLGMACALAALPRVGVTFPLAALTCALAGVFIVGAQLILFALAPLYYAQPVRATGTGASVAMGRLGSVVGPSIAGALLATGSSSASVLLAILPFVAIGGCTAFALTWCRRAA